MNLDAAGPFPSRFAKMSGAGNDFVVFLERAPAGPETGEAIRRLCDRRTGIGADGVLFVTAASRGDGPPRVVADYFNADGGASRFCANGTRCAARIASLRLDAGRELRRRHGLGSGRGADRGERPRHDHPSGAGAARADSPDAGNRRRSEGGDCSGGGRGGGRRPAPRDRGLARGVARRSRPCSSRAAAPPTPGDAGGDECQLRRARPDVGQSLSGPGNGASRTRRSPAVRGRWRRRWSRPWPGRGRAADRRRRGRARRSSSISTGGGRLTAIRLTGDARLLYEGEISYEEWS